MKKTTQLSLVLVTLLSLSGCGEDNAYNGQTGLIGGGSSVEASSNNSLNQSIKTLYSMIQTDSSNAYIQSLEMLQVVNDLSANANEENLEKAQIEFKKLALAYKRVETVYVAGYNDANMKDIAEFYIEQFIKQSKSYDVMGDLDAVFSGTKPLLKMTSKV